MSRVLPLAAEADRVIACNICGGLEHGPVFGEFLRCKGCGLVFAGNGAGLQQASGDVSDRVTLDPNAPVPGETRRVLREHLRMLHRAVGGRPGLRLLAIGTANRAFLLQASRAGFEVESHARDCRDAEGTDACFDVVTLFDGLGKMRDPLGELVSIRRLVRPGGWLLLSCMNVDGLLPRFSQAVPSRVRSSSRPLDCLYLFSDRTLAELTERAGYEVTEIGQSRMPLEHSIGPLPSWIAGRSQLVFALLFAPVALLGPWLGMGDWVCLAARRPD